MRNLAAMALENMGPDAGPAVPALVKALADEDQRVRQTAVKALGRIGPAAREAVPVLTGALKRGSWPEAEEALRQSEVRYRLIFERNPSPGWVFDHATFAFLAVNDAAIALYGYTRKEFLQMTVLEIRPTAEVPSSLRVRRGIANNEQLLAALQKLKARGNSVLVVEHDEATMRRADYIIDLGPGPGVHGGEVVATGTLRWLILASTKSESVPQPPIIAEAPASRPSISSCHGLVMLPKSTRAPVAIPAPIVPQKSHRWVGFKAHQAMTLACPTTAATLTTQTKNAELS